MSYSRSLFKSVETVIFDFDGTISDSYPHFMDIFRYFAQDRGWDLPYDDEQLLRELLVSVKATHKKLGWDQHISYDDFWKEFSALQLQRADQFRAFPAAIDLLRYATERGITCYVYTHSGKAVPEHILPNMGMVLHEGKVVKITEKYTDDKINRVVAISTEKNYIEIRIDLEKNVPVFMQLENEIAVIGKGRTDTSGSLRVGDKIKLYMKDKALYFASVTEYDKTEEYTGNLLTFGGSLYLYDNPGGYIVLDGAKAYATSEEINGFLQLQLKKDAEVYFEHAPAKIDEIKGIFDKYCFAYMQNSWSGGLERICRLVIE